MNKWCLLALILWLQMMIGVYATEIRTGVKSDRIALIVIGVLGGVAFALWRDEP